MSSVETIRLRQALVELGLLELQRHGVAGRGLHTQVVGQLLAALLQETLLFLGRDDAVAVGVHERHLDQGVVAVVLEAIFQHQPVAVGRQVKRAARMAETAVMGPGGGRGQAEQQRGEREP